MNPESEAAPSMQPRQPSPWSDHLKIAIKCWSRERARQTADKAGKVRSQDMEYLRSRDD